jgi:hypothetical protein
LLKKGEQVGVVDLYKTDGANESAPNVVFRTALAVVCMML